ncbi:MAG: TonB-dependent copper receptor [Cystobacterineae bacterium]|nr:TonB-dependent copper receptor [Cystobacterineae bacterium]
MRFSNPSIQKIWGLFCPSFPMAGRLLLLGLFSLPAWAEETPETQTSETETQEAQNPKATAVEQQMLKPVVVTAAPMDEPLTVVTDAKAPRQPIPAHDGADHLKTIPGFSIIRKGGSDGDPVFRGMAGSRLNILSNGEVILGGCGGRMDPPTAYIFPGSYDSITLLKGPQSVIWGPGSSAGTVLFEREFRPYEQSGYRLFGGLMFGSFGRNDQIVDAEMGDPSYDMRLIGTRSSMDDYLDGNGNRVHSSYMRWSIGTVLGFMPDENTRLELSASLSDGKAAYADRMMDGSKFARENLSLRFEKKKISALIEKMEAHAYYNYVDHVMDNYSLREQPGSKSVNNPDRRTTGFRLASNLHLSALSLLKVGFDQQSNWHRFRSGNDLNYRSQTRLADATFHDHGLFAEWTQTLSAESGLIAGLRVDFWKAKDQRTGVSTSGETRRDILPSGFVRYEHDFGANSLVVGLGHNERFPDFWEAISQNKQSETSNSAFKVRSEKNTQLDVGAIYRVHPKLRLSASVFVSWLKDYILIDNSRALKDASLVRNVNALTFGGEVGAAFAFARHWSLNANLAYVHGNNLTDSTPLAQMPPFDSRFTLEYDDGTWLFGALARLVAAQNRFDKNKGSIAGQDIGATPGFGVFSLNAGYRLRKNLLLLVGVDNLFNKTYAEAISRSGSMVLGYDQTRRINEPGRSFWLKLDLKL